MNETDVELLLVEDNTMNQLVATKVLANPAPAAIWRKDEGEPTNDTCP